MKKKDLISVVIPTYNEEEVINIFYDKINIISKDMKFVNFEFIFVDDGSTDNSLNIIKKLNSLDKRVRFISFSRNFGKEAAIYAGLKSSLGNFVTIMDCDLQDPPELLNDMYNAVTEEGFDAAAIYSLSHKDYSFFRNLLTKIWYKINSSLSGNLEKPGTRDYRLMSKKVIDSLLSMQEVNRYTRGLYSYMGYNIKWIAINTDDRAAGKSKFNLRKLFSYSIDAISSTSTKPLLLSAYIGLLFCLIAFIFIIIIIVNTIIWGDSVSGWPSLVCIIIFLSGIQLFFLGIIGIYLSKLYLEIKKRPLYFINDTEKDKKKGDK